MAFLDWNLKTIVSYLKSAPSNLSNGKISWDKKMPKFRTKNSLGIFGLEFKKKLMSHFKSAPLKLPNCKNLQKNKNG